jgi:hypothetical protein
MPQVGAPVTCEAYRAQHVRFSRLPLPPEVWDTPEFDGWVDHFHGCLACQTWDRLERLTARGVDVRAYPCVHMAEQATYRCETHPDPQDCPDVLVRYLPRSRAYGLPVRDGGTSMSVIRYCPWCGTELPVAAAGPAGPR